MPPPFRGGSLSAISRCKRLQPSIATIRTFSSTSYQSQIGPESPRFIDIPRPPQQSSRREKDIKGTLPVPRLLFPSRKGYLKIAPSYFAQVTPEPTVTSKLAPPQNELEAWKRRMAAMRRQNLREGLTGLYGRKRRADRKVAQRSSIKQEERQRRFEAPEREDERLMSPTILAATRVLHKGNLPDPNRESRLAVSAERVKAKALDWEQERADALHSLYMHARDFITNESELDGAIEKLFIDKPYAADPLALKPEGESMWSAYGAPPTVQDMLSEVSNTQKQAVGYHRGPAIVTGKRMVKLAEELTGGKMD